MVHSRTRTINRTQSGMLRHYINSIPSRAYRAPRSNTKPRHERPSKDFPKIQNPIPFVADVKGVEDPIDALALFRQYEETGFRHDYPSYSALLYKLARSRNYVAVESLLDYIRDDDVRCKEPIFIAIMQQYGKSRLPDKAVELFHRMPSFNCDRTIQSFNTILNVLVDNDRSGDANVIFDRSSKLGFRPNPVSYNVVIKGWLRKGDWDKACQVFDKMLEKEVQPSAVTYNSLIGFLCKRGDLEKARGILEDMTQKGKHPNAVTYALLMEGLCSVRKYNEAKKMMFDMEYRGCKPQLVNFGVLMTDLGKRGEIEAAKALLLEMKKRRLKPDVVTFNILVNYLCKKGRAAEAYKVLIDMQVEGCEPNAATYRMMVDGFCKVEDFERALRVLNAMLISRHYPRSETFHCLVAGLVEHGKMEDVSFVLEEMEKKKVRFQLGAWEALVRGACSGDTGSSELVNELVVMH